MIKKCEYCKEEFLPDRNHPWRKICGKKECRLYLNRLRNKKYRETEKGKNVAKESRIRNRESMNISKKKWEKENYHKIKRYRSNPEIKEKYNIRARDAHRYKKLKKSCSQCGSKENLEVHHKDYKKSIIDILCRRCHRLKHPRGLFLILIMLSSLFLFGCNQYSPETDVCEELQEWYKAGEDIPYKSECYKWHPKSKCELNPNDESCVCDEYEIKVLGKNICGYSFQLVEENRYNCQITKNVTTDNCIKAHEPTIHDLTCEELKEGFMYPCGRNSICLSTTAGDKEKEYLLEILERC